MTARKVDPTLIRHADAAIRVVLRIVLVIAILAVFGIETTSFAALLAAAGIAIGAALHTERISPGRSQGADRAHGAVAKTGSVTVV